MKICIDSEWYELSKWAQYHPGGVKILEDLDGCDATDAFYSLHSNEAVQKLKNMRPYDSKAGIVTPKADPVDAKFREFKAKLEADGWWKRSMFEEIRILAPIVLLVVWSTIYASTYPILAILGLGLAMQQAGWLGHDMTHARHSLYCDTLLPLVSGWLNGFDRNWWSNKHNTHHVFTNHIGMDPDIDNRPVLFLWAPPKALDTAFRKFQHIYFIFAYFFLYASWRLQSIQTAIAQRNYKMLFLVLLPSYVYLATLPLVVSIGSVLWGGFLVAIVVTLSHESEELLTERMPSYCRTQFVGSRDIVCPDPITEYLGGGMQYQLEHHLFPTMPRYKYRDLTPLVKQFAKENGLEYKSSPIGEMLSMHINTLKTIATVPSID